MISLSPFRAHGFVGILVLGFEVLTSSGAIAQISKLKPSAATLLSPSLLDPNDDQIQHFGRIASTKGLSKSSAFTDGTIRGYNVSKPGQGAMVSRKDVSVYANNRLMKYAYIYPATTSRPTAQVILYLYHYDQNGLATEVVRPGYGKWTRSYNDSGKIVTSLLTLFQGTTGEYPASRTTYTYFNATVLTQILVETYVNSAWLNSIRQRDYYGVSGVLDSLIVEQWQNGWIVQQKNIYRYDTLNRTTTSLNYYWYPPTGSISLYSRTITVKDTLGNVMQTVNDTYTANTDTWTPQSRITYAYDSEGFMTTSVQYYWDSYGTTWTSIFRSDYTKYPSPSVTLIAPTEGDNYPPNSELIVQWLAAGTSYVDLAHSTDNGLTWNSMGTNLPDTGVFSYSWAAPSAEYTQCKVKVSAHGNPSVQHILEGTFSTINRVYSVHHATNNVQVDILNNGYIGADGNGIGAGFSYKSSANALFSGGVFLGTNTGPGKGMVGSFSMADFQNSTPLHPLSSDGHFDQRGFVSIQEVYPYYQCGIEIKTASRVTDDFVFVSYLLRNNSYSIWDHMYVGMFADWDIGNLTSNQGGIDSIRGLAYQYDASQSPIDSNYYGIVAFKKFSGATITDGVVTSASLVSTITVCHPSRTSADNRMFIGVGPFTISAGDSQAIDFALVAGSSLTDLKAHADQAIALWKTGVVAVREPAQLPVHFALHQNYPNPFNPSTTIEFELPSRSKAKIEILNLLGQRIATIMDGEQDAGLHRVEWNADVPSGIYFCRMTATASRESRTRFIEVKKMILLK